MDEETLRKNFEENCIPTSILEGEVPDYDTFLVERRKYIAYRIRQWYDTL